MVNGGARKGTHSSDWDVRLYQLGAALPEADIVSIAWACPITAPAGSTRQLRIGLCSAVRALCGCSACIYPCISVLYIAGSDSRSERLQSKV